MKKRSNLTIVLLIVLASCSSKEKVDVELVYGEIIDDRLERVQCTGITNYNTKLVFTSEFTKCKMKRLTRDDFSFELTYPGSFLGRTLLIEKSNGAWRSMLRVSSDFFSEAEPKWFPLNDGKVFLDTVNKEVFFSFRTVINKTPIDTLLSGDSEFSILGYLHYEDED